MQRCFFILFIGFLFFTSHCSKDRPKNPPSAEVDYGESLPLPILEKNISPWFISKISNPEQLSVDNNSLFINYIPFKFGSDSGAAFKANPKHALPKDVAILSYDVYFPENFNWVKGGKLPGFCFGTKSGACASGGDWYKDAGSFRVMWREEGKAIGYLYLAIDGGSEAAYNLQNEDYKKIAERTGITGHTLWKDIDQPMLFHKGWNSVRLFLKLNDKDSYDGKIALTINKVTHIIEQLKLRQDNDVKINDLIITSFFGGGSGEWSSPIKTYTAYKNFGFK